MTSKTKSPAASDSIKAAIVEALDERRNGEKMLWKLIKKNPTIAAILGLLALSFAPKSVEAVGRQFILGQAPPVESAEVKKTVEDKMASLEHKADHAHKVLDDKVRIVGNANMIENAYQTKILEQVGAKAGIDPDAPGKAEVMGARSMAATALKADLKPPD